VAKRQAIEGRSYMSTALIEYLARYRAVFQQPLVEASVLGVVGVLTLALVVNRLLLLLGRVDRQQYTDVQVRSKTWCWLVLGMLVPILLGPAWLMVAVLGLSLVCYREFARATGLFREQQISVIVVLGMVALTLANVVHYDRMYFALASLTVVALAIITIPSDRPKGYMQRTALGAFGFLLFGYSFGYLGFMANDERFRSIVLLILICVEMNDVFAYCVGKALGGPKLVPNTSPGKTRAGSLGALVLTTGLAMLLGHAVFRQTPVDQWNHLLELGLMIAVLGQMGDLVLSSIKRDLGIKDLGVVLRGHGGWLDRFDSLVLVPPAVFHFLSYHLGPLGSAAHL
jgi:phosphatidate cytidylyltransferase